MWEVISQSEETWFDAYVSQIISSEAPKLPPHEGAIGHTEWFWYSPEPGHYYVQTDGGTDLDRYFAHHYVANQLEAFGLKVASPVSWNGNGREEVQGKALRLIRENKVQVHDNAPNFISGTVQGDHGTYQPEIQRDPSQSPRSQNGLISGHCQCDWGGFMNTPRTRNWKQYQNAPCAHLIALWWLAQSMPTDGGESGPQPQGPSDTSQFTPLYQNPIRNFAPGAPAPGTPVGLTPRPDTGTMQQNFSPDEAEGMTAGPGMMGPEGALPQAEPEPLDIDPNGSVPGKKPPSPANPIQYPGGTFSSVKESADMFNEGEMVQTKNDDWGTGVGDPGYSGVGQQLPIPAGSIGEVRGVHPSTGMVEVFVNGGPFLQNKQMTAMGATAWFLPNELQRRPDLRGGSPMIRRT